MYSVIIVQVYNKMMKLVMVKFNKKELPKDFDSSPTVVIVDDMIRELGGGVIARVGDHHQVLPGRFGLEGLV